MAKREPAMMCSYCGGRMVWNQALMRYDHTERVADPDVRYDVLRVGAGRQYAIDSARERTRSDLPSYRHAGGRWVTRLLRRPRVRV